jgi:hypothetical protein
MRMKSTIGALIVSAFFYAPANAFAQGTSTPATNGLTQ